MSVLPAPRIVQRCERRIHGDGCSRSTCADRRRMRAVRDAFRHRLPLLLKGPTGCGKTRFVAHMAARLGLPLHTVACHDDLTAADLTGRYLLKGGDTVWTDGPLTRAVREGGICYLDEVVEARKDVTVVLHPLTDDRRILPLERTGETLHGARRASCSWSPTTPATRTC